MNFFCDLGHPFRSPFCFLLHVVLSFHKILDKEISTCIFTTFPSFKFPRINQVHFGKYSFIFILPFIFKLFEVQFKSEEVLVQVSYQQLSYFYFFLLLLHPSSFRD